jgi:hypothetical protein
VDVSKLSQAQLVQYLAVKEYEKQMMRYERAKAKMEMTNAPKDHKFWNTQVCFFLFFLFFHILSSIYVTFAV